MLARLRTWWDSHRGERITSHAYRAGMLGTLLLGSFLRVNGWLGNNISFWLDEALWASRLLHWPLLDLGIRPVGFMGLTRVLVRAFGATEVWFRFLPAVGAVGSLLLMPYVASRLVASKWVRLLLVLMFAIHPALVDYANEFKPYSWEVLVHLTSIALYLRFRQTANNLWLYALVAYLPVSFLLAYNMALAFPGLLLLCLSLAWRSPQRRKLVSATLLSGALCAGLGLLIFQLSLKNVTKETRTENYWGKKYDVFFEKTETQSRLDWTIQKYSDMATFVSLRQQQWDGTGKLSERTLRELASADRLLWLGLSLAGVWALWRRRRDLLLVLLAPLLTMTLGNFLGKWPLGAFRTNLFVLVYTLPLPFLGIELLAVTRRAAVTLGTLVAGLTLLPGFALGFDWHGHKRTFTRDFYAREVLAKLHDYRKQQLAERPGLPQAHLMLDLHSWHPVKFYLHDQPKFREKYEAYFADNFRLSKVSSDDLGSKVAQRMRKAKPGEGLWLVSSSRREFAGLKRATRRATKVVIEEEVADEHLIMYVEPKAE